jgi:hypothetical protein
MNRCNKPLDLARLLAALHLVTVQLSSVVRAKPFVA